MALITEKTDDDSIVSQIGETQINPTQYTIEDRLKTLNASVLTINPTSGNFTTTNSSNIDASKSDLDNILIANDASVISTNLILASEGLPVLAPVQYTMLDRLITLNNSLNNVNKSFNIHAQIIRPANTTTYGTGFNIINNSGSTILPYFDFSSLGINKNIEIKNIDIASNNAFSPTNYYIIFIKNSTVGSWGDGVNYVPSYANSDISQNFATLPVLSNGYTGSYNQVQSNQLVSGGRIRTKIDNNGFLYFVLYSPSMTPGSAQIIDITVCGTILN
jgi:hypothetical protein